MRPRGACSTVCAAMRDLVLRCNLRGAVLSESTARALLDTQDALCTLVTRHQGDLLNMFFQLGVYFLPITSAVSSH